MNHQQTNMAEKKSKQGRREIKCELICQICDSPANHHSHYGATTCYSCRAFFRRMTVPPKAADIDMILWPIGQLQGASISSLFLGGAHFLSARRLLRITILKDWDSLKVWESFRVRESLKSFQDFLKVSKIS